MVSTFPRYVSNDGWNLLKKLRLFLGYISPSRYRFSQVFYKPVLHNI